MGLASNIIQEEIHLLPIRAPLITVGQIYLNPMVNEYLIVTKNNRGQVFYSGKGFRGQSEDETFLDRFPPVDPADVEPQELRDLLEFVPIGTRPTTGFIREDHQ